MFICKLQKKKANENASFSPTGGHDILSDHIYKPHNQDSLAHFTTEALVNRSGWRKSTFITFTVHKYSYSSRLIYPSPCSLRASVRINSSFYILLLCVLFRPLSLWRDMAENNIKCRGLTSVRCQSKQMKPKPKGKKQQVFIYNDTVRKLIHQKKTKYLCGIGNSVLPTSEVVIRAHHIHILTWEGVHVWFFKTRKLLAYVRFQEHMKADSYLSLNEWGSVGNSHESHWIDINSPLPLMTSSPPNMIDRDQNQWRRAKKVRVKVNKKRSKQTATQNDISRNNIV